MHKDPTARETHYKLTELGDETRHMVMFGKAIERVGAKPGAATAVSADDHQRAAAGVQGIAAMGRRADRRGDLRLPAAPDDGRPRAAANGAAAHAYSRHRGGPPHPVRPRARKRVADMPRINRLWVANLNGVGGLFFQYLFTNPVPYRRAESTPAGRGASHDAARTATKSRWRASHRWPRSSRRSA